MPHMFKRLAHLFGCTLVAFAAGCASTSSVTTLYQADGHAASSVLVAARLPDQAQRRQYEDACLPALGWKGRQLVAAHEPLPNWYAGENTALVNTAQALGLDTILVLELSTLLLSPMQLPPRNDVSQERFSGPVGSQPGPWQMQIEGEAVPTPPETLSFQARLMASTGTTLWEGLVHTHEANDLQAIARSQCEALGKALQQAGLVP